MTVAQLQKKIEEILKEGNCDSPSFDAVCLLEDLANLGRGKVPFLSAVQLSDEITHQVIEAAEKRAKGFPLQYLLGKWDFLNLSLYVGEGVLIPRPETEQLCELVADKLCGISFADPIQLADLCAGTGCVGLGIASLSKTKSLNILSVELSEKALPYLQKNIQRYPQYNATAICADILSDFDRFQEPFDIIVSNPPYIPTADLTTLQREVQWEPKTALDGREDGLLFYNALAKHWVPKLSKHGFIAVEVGIHQASAVVQLFKQAGLINVQSYKDFSGIDRFVIGEKSEKNYYNP